jgi:hypothetical protein
MPNFLGVIEKTETYYVRINAPSKQAAEMWGTDIEYDDFTEDNEHAMVDVDMRKVIDPAEKAKRKVRGRWRRTSTLPFDVTQRWMKQRAHVRVDEEGEEIA